MEKIKKFIKLNKSSHPVYYIQNIMLHYKFKYLASSSESPLKKLHELFLFVAFVFVLESQVLNVPNFKIIWYRVRYHHPLFWLN